MVYLQLFLSFLKIGAFSFGGGYAAMPLIQEAVVDAHPWLSMHEFTDLVTISQMTPGPIAINAATFVGTKIGGLSGALVATAGCVLPSCVLVLIVTRFYLKYRKLDALQSVLRMLRPAVVALIAGAGLSILVTALWGGGAVRISETNLTALVLFLLSLFLLIRRRMNPIWVMLLAGVLNAAIQAVYR